MIFIGGISQGSKILEYVKTVICRICGGYGRYQVTMTYTYFSFFFIPLFQWNRHFYVTMSCCNAVYELRKEVGMAILKGGQPDITEADLTLIQGGNKKVYDDENGYRTVKCCPVCGFETEEDFAYCPKCGHRM